MKFTDVPQDKTSALEGHKKPMYVVNKDGKYTTRLSSGWEPEEVVLQQAIAQFKQQAVKVLQQAKAGEASPLEFYMYQNRMDLRVLAQSTGYFKWRVKRHLRVEVYRRLPPKVLERYAEAFGVSLDQLKTLPDTIS